MGGLDCVSCASDGLCVCSCVPLVVLCVFHLLRFVRCDYSKGKEWETDIGVGMQRKRSRRRPALEDHREPLVQQTTGACRRRLPIAESPRAIAPAPWPAGGRILTPQSIAAHAKG